MEIIYGSARIKKYCSNFKQAQKKFGLEVATGLFKTLQFIESAKCLNDLICHRPFSFHRLQGDKKHLCSIDIIGRKSKWRLYVIPCDENCGSLVQDFMNNKFEIIHIELKEVKDHG